MSAPLRSNCRTSNNVSSIDAAWDANLIGIDPDFRIHVSDHLLAMNDGPMLEQGIKAMAGREILLPTRKADWPNRNRLAERFESFLRAQ